MQAVLKTLHLPGKIRSFGSIAPMDDHEKRKLRIFNVLNVLGFLIGIFLPIVGLSVANIKLSTFAWFVTFSPAMVSIMVLVLNYYKRHEIAILSYFILYPILTALVYQVSFDIGVELFFILYGVLSVFFLNRFVFIVVAFSLTLFCYFYVFVFTRHYEIVMVDKNFHFYVLNHVLPACFIFYALFLIKRENTQYEGYILQHNTELHQVNLEIQIKNDMIDQKARQLQEQNRVIDEKARLLQKQTTELSELNSMKNKLFSVISHDLKTPLYALRNLFKTIQQYDIPAEEVKQYVPEVVHNLNYTTALMENLLIWVKSQMQINVMQPQILEISELIDEAKNLLQLQAQAKKIHVHFSQEHPVYIYADKEMISLVIRNLLSNAIKFTPENGDITLGIKSGDKTVELFVKDSGVGMEPSVVQQLFGNNYYTSRGTADETGTGLGLMICKDFLTRNGGTIHVESTVGKGSTFFVTLPKKRFV